MPITVDDVRRLAEDLASALDAASDRGSAAALRRAAETAADDPEGLLQLRSAIVATRSGWERAAPEELRRTASRMLSAAKRLAIALGEG